MMTLIGLGPDRGVMIRGEKDRKKNNASPKRVFGFCLGCSLSPNRPAAFEKMVIKICISSQYGVIYDSTGGEENGRSVELVETFDPFFQEASRAEQINFTRFSCYIVYFNDCICRRNRWLDNHHRIPNRRRQCSNGRYLWCWCSRSRRIRGSNQSHQRSRACRRHLHIAIG